MTVQRADTFTRANVTTGWGTATDGNTWTSHAGDGQSVATNEGVVNLSTASTFATLGASLSGADGEGLVRFEVQDNTNTLGILLRYQDLNNYYLARFDGAGHIAFFKNIAGTKTTVGSYVFAPSTTTRYWLRFHVSGTTIEIKTWADGGTEPGTWNYTTTDSGIAGTGGNNFVGLYGFSNASPNNYDSFSVDDLVVPAIALSGTLPTGQALSAALSISVALASALPSASGLSSLTLSTGVNFSGVLLSGAALPPPVLAVTRPLSATLPSTSALAGTLILGATGVGIGDITRSTGVQTANKSGNGYGTGDITGTEHDYIYKDATGSGWAVGANPWYGGMPFSAWYQIDPGLNATLPQRTSATGNLMSLLTTQSGGIVHWEEDGAGGFQSSELVTFNGAGNLSELAPANTAFRAYLKVVGDAPDGNGISWTAYACVYPGDPGFVVFRFDQHNGTGAAISIDESDIEVIASLLTDTGSPAGVWNPAHAFIGTIGGSVINGWPADGVHQTGTFDYTGITPDPASGIVLGTGAVVLADPSSQFGWTQGGYEAHISAASATPGRIKFGWYSDVSSPWSIPAGQTNTYYVLRVFRRNLTSADMAAIAADFKFPGTPTTTTGTYTGFSTDERANVFAAASNALSATLDLSPAHVTTRFKPTLKITNWTTVAPTLAWGGAALIAGTDYRYVVDSVNSILYVQLYFDVVASGATSGQRNNAQLAVTSGAIALTGILPSAATLSAPLTVTRPLSATLHTVSALTATLLVTHALTATLPTATGYTAQLTVSRPLTAVLPTSAAFVALSGVTRPLAASVVAGAGLAAGLGVVRALTATLPTQDNLTGTLLVLGSNVPLAVSLPSSAGLVATLQVTHALACALPTASGFSVALQVTRRLTVTLPSQSGLSVPLPIQRPLAATLTAASGLSGVLGVPSGVILLSGSLAPSAALTSVTLQVTRALAPVALAATPTAFATLLSPRALSATLPAAASLSGTLLTIFSLRPTALAPTPAVTGALVVSRPLVCSLPAPAATFTATRPSIPRALASVLPTQSGLTGIATVPGTVLHLGSVSLAATPTIQALLGVTRPLLALVVVSSPAVTGSLFPTRALHSSVTSDPAMTGSTLAHGVALSVSLPAPVLVPLSLLACARPLAGSLLSAPALTSGTLSLAPTGILYLLALTLTDAPLATLSLTSATGG